MGRKYLSHIWMQTSCLSSKVTSNLAANIVFYKDLFKIMGLSLRTVSFDIVDVFGF